MKKLIAFVPLCAVLAACGSSPTAGSTATSSQVRADERTQAPPQDTTQRVPNLFGSGN